jgi:hypothetical protein
MKIKNTKLEDWFFIHSLNKKNLQELKQIQSIITKRINQNATSKKINAPTKEKAK